MDLRHYDNVAHGLNASYEDVQEGMSTPYGIARTTTLTLIPQKGYAGKEAFADVDYQHWDCIIRNSRHSDLSVIAMKLNDVIKSFESKEE